jgi:surfeit locus 1 family protein
MTKFDPGWRMTALLIFMLPVLLSLGAWQLERGAQKRTLENQYLAKLTELPVAPSPEALSQPFQALRLSGRYHPEIFLLDNQVSNGNVGFWVYQVFSDHVHGRLLINRGFVASAGRDSLPSIQTPTTDISMIATAWPQLGLIPVWGNQQWSASWPKVIQRANVDRMAQMADTWPVELRLEPGQPSVLEPAPFASRLTDDKHRGYAVTWFGLAVVLVLGYCYLGFTHAVNRE